MKEAKILIEGTELEFSQSMCLRIAIQTELIRLDDINYLQEMGPIGVPYRRRLEEIQSLIMKGCK